jgi:catechol 2,3-dioxygenase-like lactoylglutathione lyase family enzyme
MTKTEQMFTGFNHVCVVTADVDRAVRTYSDSYGIGPWRVFVYDESNMSVKVDGEHLDFGMRVGLCQIAPGFVIELIQPIGDGNPYAESLQAHGGADHVHHLKLEAADFARTSERLEGLGVSRVFDGTFRGVDEESIAHGVYYSTEQDLGFLVEIGEMSPTFEVGTPEYVYPVDATPLPAAAR